MGLYALAYMYRNRLRVHAAQEILAGLGVAVAVALVSATLIANSSVAGSAAEVVHTVVGPANLQVRSQGPEGFDEALLPRIEHLPGRTAGGAATRRDSDTRRTERPPSGRLSRRSGSGARDAGRSRAHHPAPVALGGRDQPQRHHRQGTGTGRPSHGRGALAVVAASWSPLSAPCLGGARQGSRRGARRRAHRRHTASRPAAARGRTRSRLADIGRDEAWRRSGRTQGLDIAGGRTSHGRKLRSGPHTPASGARTERPGEQPVRRHQRSARVPVRLQRHAVDGPGAPTDDRRPARRRNPTRRDHRDGALPGAVPWPGGVRHRPARRVRPGCWTLPSIGWIPLAGIHPRLVHGPRHEPNTDRAGLRSAGHLSRRLDTPLLDLRRGRARDAVYDEDSAPGNQLGSHTHHRLTAAAVVLLLAASALFGLVPSAALASLHTARAGDDARGPDGVGGHHALDRNARRTLPAAHARAGRVDRAARDDAALDGACRDGRGGAVRKHGARWRSRRPAARDRAGRPPFLELGPALGDQPAGQSGHCLIPAAEPGRTSLEALVGDGSHGIPRQLHRLGRAPTLDHRSPCRRRDLGPSWTDPAGRRLAGGRATARRRLDRPLQADRRRTQPACGRRREPSHSNRPRRAPHSRPRTPTSAGPRV